MRTLLSAAVAVVIGLALGPAEAQDMKKVRIGTEGAYPPFNQIDSNGELTGFDIEIGDALCAAAKLDCEWIVQDWDGIIPGLQAEKYDAILASMSITPERAEVVDFTDAYYQEAGAVIGPDDTEFMENLKATVAGKVIGVQSATTHENFVRDVLGDVVGEIKIYDSVEQAHLDLVAGRIDFFSDGLIAVTGGFLDTDLGDGHAVIGEPFTHPEIHGAGAGIAVRKGDEELKEAFNVAIKAIRDDGTYQKISDKYFGVDIFGE
ncbi:MAG: transporter substrate-binding domain-containing protein [Hyphomicrobiales bacterium]|nr:transporter substrate-binding domain-containing protein [Hyphomicrobiales bacterium]